jgi:hypothetical protein
LVKKEAAAPPPPAYQLLHHHKHVYESRQFGLIYLLWYSIYASER